MGREKLRIGATFFEKLLAGISQTLMRNGGGAYKADMREIQERLDEIWQLQRCIPKISLPVLFWSFIPLDGISNGILISTVSCQRVASVTVGVGVPRHILITLFSVMLTVLPFWILWNVSWVPHSKKSKLNVITITKMAFMFMPSPTNAFLRLLPNTSADISAYQRFSKGELSYKEKNGNVFSFITA